MSQLCPSICEWPQEDRPREKLLEKGAEHLSNSELLAILLRTGRKGESALDLARRALNHFQSFHNMSNAALPKWAELKGLGHAKIAQIKAAIEIGRRFREMEMRQNGVSIRSSRDIFEMFAPHMKGLPVEVFKTVLLNGQNQIIRVIDEHKGTVNQANPIIREILKNALDHFASSIICIHNHPSGTAEPSVQDKQFTKRLEHAALVLQIPFLDHVIIGETQYFSFADEGFLTKEFGSRQNFGD